MIELFEGNTPVTVQNFLTYVNDDSYIDSFFHRSDPDFVIQGGGYTTDSPTFTNTSQFTEIPDHGKIQNESLLSNEYGTIGMARTSDYNSATSQFYINLDDNDFLDPSSSTAYDGYTVFGQVLDMTTVEIIESLPVDNSNHSPFGELPYNSSDQLVVVESVEGLGDVTGYKFYDADSDGVFDGDEAGIEGVAVFIDADDDGELDNGETWTTTDSDGKYLLQVEPGDYVVCAEVTFGSTATVESVDVTVEIGVETSDVNLGEFDLSFPTACADFYAVDENETLTVDADSGVLDNDDPDREYGSLTASLLDSPEHGTLSFAEDGSFTYMPDEDYNGPDTFTYCAAGSVPVSVSGDLNGDGIVSSVDLDAVRANWLASVTPGDFSSGDTNEDGTVDSVDLDLIRANWERQVPLSVSAETTVTIAVNPANDTPVARPDAYTIDEDNELIAGAAAGVLANDTDDGPHIAVLVGGPNNGTLTLEDSGAFMYEPDADFNGTDTFTYYVTDGEFNSATATVIITVNAVNDTPVAAEDAYSINEDNTLTVNAAAGVLANDTDADGDALEVAVYSGPSHGLLALAANGSFEYTPDDDYYGTDTFIYYVEDSVAASWTTVTITVNPVNDTPTAEPDAYTIDEDNELIAGAAAGVLANDTDDGPHIAVLVGGPEQRNAHP